jgi:hypothetical protein
MLEDALTALHASKDGVDGTVHPLLVDGEDVPLGADDAAPLQPSSARRTSQSWEVLEAAPDSATSNASPEIDAFGTLSISDHGISTFFGPTGGCEVYTVFVFTVYALPVAGSDARRDCALFPELCGAKCATWACLSTSL